MNRIKYTSEKWEKRKEILLDEAHYDYEYLELVKKNFEEGKIDDIKYHYQNYMCQGGLFIVELLRGNTQKAKDYLSSMIEDMIKASSDALNREGNQVTLNNVTRNYNCN